MWISKKNIFDTTQNSTNGSFLKVNAIWNLKLLSVKCLYTVAFKFHWSFCTLHRYLTHLVHTDYLENIGSPSYVNIINAETYFALSKITLISALISLEQSLSLGKLSSMKFSSILIFTQKCKYHYWQKIMSVVYPKGSLHFWEVFTKYPSIESQFLHQLFFQGKMVYMKSG